MSGLIKNRTSVFRRCGLKILLIFVFPIIYFFCGFREVRVPAVLSPSQGLFRTGVPPPVLKGNLVAQNEGVVQGEPLDLSFLLRLTWKTYCPGVLRSMDYRITLTAKNHHEKAVHDKVQMSLAHQ
jgi:hypothetical protein